VIKAFAPWAIDVWQCKSSTPFAGITAHPLQPAFARFAVARAIEEVYYRDDALSSAPRRSIEHNPLTLSLSLTPHLFAPPLFVRWTGDV